MPPDVPLDVPSDPFADDEPSLPPASAFSSSDFSSLFELVGEASVPAPLPAPREPHLKELRRNVHALYEDARAHIRLERQAASNVAQLQKEVSELQRAFKHLAEVAIDEIEQIRSDLGDHQRSLGELRGSEGAIRELQHQVAALVQAQQIQTEQASELRRLRSAKEDAERRQALVEEELRKVRLAAAIDREAADEAIKALRDFGGLLDERRARTDTEVRTLREALRSVSRDQAAMQTELGALGHAFRRASLGRDNGAFVCGSGSVDNRRPTVGWSGAINGPLDEAKPHEPMPDKEKPHVSRGGESGTGVGDAPLKPHAAVEHVTYEEALAAARETARWDQAPRGVQEGRALADAPSADAPGSFGLVSDPRFPIDYRASRWAEHTGQ